MAVKLSRKTKKMTFFIDEDTYEKFHLKAANEGYSMQRALQLLMDRYANEKLPYFEEMITKVG